MKTEIRFGTVSKAPSKIVCVGRNYVEHVEELGNEVPDEMVIFLKPNSAISPVLHATHADEELHYEGEICFGVLEGEFRYVGFGLDLTKRLTQTRLKAKGLPWERSKSFDGSAVFSEFTEFDGELDSLEVELCIDGVSTQKGGVTQMIFKPAKILKEIASVYRIEDYDIVMTGTPKGVGKVVSGATFEGIVRSGGKQLASGKWTAE